MAYTNHDFHLLNEPENAAASITIVQQTTYANLFYTKVTTDGLLSGKVDKSTLASNYYDKSNIAN